MIFTSKMAGLQIESPLAVPSAANFRPESWPPSNDFAVVINSYGKVVSRFGDPVWDLSPWAKKRVIVTFGEGETRGKRISPANSALLRQIAAWALWGPNAVRSAVSLGSRVEMLKHIFIICTEENILASELWRYPKVIELLATKLPPSIANVVVVYLKDIWAARESLGFFIADEASIRQLSGLVTSRKSTQTAYIPPRIWTYQVLRLRACLDDFIAHKGAIEECYRFCVDAYATNAGGLPLAFAGLKSGQLPFHPANLGKKHPGRVFYGAFRLTAEKFGLDALFERWTKASDRAGIKALTSYLTLVSYASIAHILNFSLMRSDEAFSLRAKCYSRERDLLGEDIHMLGGVTTKTVHEEDARWIVSPSVEMAVEVLCSVSRLRLEVVKHDPRFRLSLEDIENPFLMSCAYEPWSSILRHGEVLRKSATYKQVIDTICPKLFDVEQLRITSEDLAVAKTLTFGLDPDEYSVGKVWPFAWHQLRRTGAVNALSNGVSDAALQYQLKHASRAMSRYYGQNYYHLKANLNDNARSAYLREMYQSLARQFEGLQSERFVSPHGEKRKSQILAPISEKDHAGLTADAKAGRVSYRETFIGGCAKHGSPCPLGGISNIAGCLGFGETSPCEFALVDRAKRPIIEALLRSGRQQLAQAPVNSPIHTSLQAHCESAERALNVIDQI